MTNIVDFNSFLSKRDTSFKQETITVLEDLEIPPELTMIMSPKHQLNEIINKASRKFPTDLKISDTIRILHVINDILNNILVPFHLPAFIFCQEIKYYDKNKVEKIDRAVKIDFINVKELDAGLKPLSEICIQLRISNYFDEFVGGSNIDISDFNFNNHRTDDKVIKSLIRNIIQISNNSNGKSFVTPDSNLLLFFIPFGQNTQLNITVEKRHNF